MGEGNQVVRRVIQHKRTGHYLTLAGGWTESIDEAHHLPNVMSAVRMTRTLELKDVELVLKFPGGNYDVRLDL